MREGKERVCRNFMEGEGREVLHLLEKSRKERKRDKMRGMAWGNECVLGFPPLVF